MNILWLRQISKKHVSLVGGKNASLGEMYSKLGRKIRIPDAFCLTSNAYWYFLKSNKIDRELRKLFKGFNAQNIKSLQETGKKARTLILNGVFPSDLEKEILRNYRKLCRKYKQDSVAVRSSATAEDMADASFAGQMETFLNINNEKDLLLCVKKCMASLFTDRAIAYREEKGFKHLKIALSVGIGKMINSSSSGVMFTMDTETGFRDVVLINSIFGVGEMIVQGKITPDEFYVFKPTLKRYKPIISKELGRKNRKYVFDKSGLKEVPEKRNTFSITDEEVLVLAKWACIIEEHYGTPQDIEWAKDKTGLYIVQSRPETVHSLKKHNVFEEYKMESKKKPIVKGIAIGDKIGQGKARVISDVSKIAQFKKGEVLVTKMTNPDWVPIMRIASAIITDEGGKTAHAAIISREFGIPCIVGTQKATKILKTGDELTVDCTKGLNGRVFKGIVPYNVKKYNLKKIPKLKTKIMINIGAPDIAFKTSFLPNDGVGLAREEFIIAEKVRIHPLALYNYSKLKDKKLKKRINDMTIGYKDKNQYFIDKLAQGIGQIGAAFYPKDVIVRFSDFKTNEYAQLIGGSIYEPEESNPMLGWRGASRYYDETFKPAFIMECQAVKKAIQEFGLKNIKVMVPFCRTVEEGERVMDLIRKSGLDKVKVYVMCEIPSNVVLINEFLNIFDGVSVGSNDLSQMVLGIDRDSAILHKVGDERNPAVKKMIARVIEACNKRKKYCGICGQAPSDFIDFARFLVKHKIHSISLNPDTVIKTILKLSK